MSTKIYSFSARLVILPYTAYLHTLILINSSKEL